MAGADLVYIALPVGLTIERLPEIARHAAPGALVTDAASTKRAVCAAADKCVFAGERVFSADIPWPAAKSPESTPRTQLFFRARKYALIGGRLGRCAGQKKARSRRTRASRTSCGLLEGIGARPYWMDAATHDRAAAIVSHLPQLMAVALAGVVREATDQTGLPLTLAGRGLRDALRLAGSPYAVWRDIVLTNTDHLDAALDRMAQAIEHLRAPSARARTRRGICRRQRGL